MPQIIPIKDLRDTTRISEMCHNSDEPIFVTKNGYGASVLVSIDYFQKHLGRQDRYDRIAKAESEIDAGLGIDARESLRRTRARIHG